MSITLSYEDISWKANLEETLLTQANIALMEQPLHMREIEE